MILNVWILFLLLFELNLSEVHYKGESFPVKYLQAEDVAPEYSDVEYYLRGLNKMLDYSMAFVNSTDVNWALGIFFMKAILKRTSRENKNKIHEEQVQLIKNITFKAENIMSHYYCRIRADTWASLAKRVLELFKDEDLQVQGIEQFNRNRLQKWILSNTSINDFAQVMDELKLQRLDYLKYTDQSMESGEYSVNIDDSDYCLGEIIYNPKPLDNLQMFKPCVGDEFCSAVLYQNIPSISYTLSHRMLNVMFPRHIRRCYMRSVEEDDELMDTLCSSMYRETVFIARLGYFNRDMWMEHIALCALLGYEEFHRRHWFQKVMSWLDDQGCIAENFNCLVNRTRISIENAKDPEEQRRLINKKQDSLKNPCHWHQMALSLVVLAHGVRHAVHFNGRIKVEPSEAQL